MPRQTQHLDLDVDLNGGVVPISKVASSLAALIKRSRERQQPIVVTQKGYPSGVLLPVEVFVSLRDQALHGLHAAEAAAALRAEDAAPLPEVAPEPAEEEAPPAAPERKPRGGRKARVEP